MDDCHRRRVGVSPGSRITVSDLAASASRTASGKARSGSHISLAGRSTGGPPDEPMPMRT